MMTWLRRLREWRERKRLQRQERQRFLEAMRRGYNIHPVTPGTERAKNPYLADGGVNQWI